MTTQRKIHHVLRSEGQDRTFRYLPVLQALFDLAAPILVTEKVDGSTMQTQDGEPWKRFDRFSKGDPRKRDVSEDERYELRRCQADDPGVKWYLAAFDAHREQLVEFGRRFPGYWLYFEAMGARIGARYRDLDPTIRVFDISDDNGFMPFDAAGRIAAEVGLPVVFHRHEVFGDLPSMLAQLAGAKSGDPRLPNHTLEGWVLRQTCNGREIVAKIRIKDLDKLVGRSN